MNKKTLAVIGLGAAYLLRNKQTRQNLMNQLKSFAAKTKAKS
ncbi:hypothetical protein [Paenibacillus periandrae]|jgi:hypothetical protein|nr:hypothetical protein [Paenibacillus periandrae]